MKALAKKFLNSSEFNGPLLAFLLLFLNAKLPVKLLALAGVFIYSKYIKKEPTEGVSAKAPVFYSAILVIEVIKYLFITQIFEVNYLLTLGLGCFQWALCIAGFAQLKRLCGQYSAQATAATIKIFFSINTLVSFFFFAILLMHPQWLGYWGHGADLRLGHPSAGDAILGVSLDSSAVNAAINLLGLIYFMHRKEKLMAALCLAVIVMCTSNITLFISLAVLVIFFLTTRLRYHRWLSAGVLVFLLGSYLYSSPSNREYMWIVWLKATSKPESIAPPEEYYHQEKHTEVQEKKTEVQEKHVEAQNQAKTEEAAPPPVIAPAEIPWPTAHGLFRIDSVAFYTKPGKFISFLQTANYLAADPIHALFGAGIGNFSSKLAFRVGGAEILGRYPAQYGYRSAAFEANHWATFMHYYMLPAAEHSNLNYPFSTVNQILGEYGLIGAALFLFGYVGYFMRRWRYLTYGRYLLPALLLFFVTDYWFEYFSLVIVFEIMMLLNIREVKEKETATPAV